VVAPLSGPDSAPNASPCSPTAPSRTQRPSTTPARVPRLTVVATPITVYGRLYNRVVVEVGSGPHDRRYSLQSFARPGAVSACADRPATCSWSTEGALLTLEGRSPTPRAQNPRPWVQEVFDWCDQEFCRRTLRGLSDPHRITYVRNQRQALERFLFRSRLPLTKHQSEGALRQEAVAARTVLRRQHRRRPGNSVFVSLLASCELHGPRTRELACAICYSFCRAGLRPDFWSCPAEMEGSDEHGPK